MTGATPLVKRLPEPKNVSTKTPASGAPQVQLAPPQVADRRIRSSPLVRKIAKEHGIDLRMVPGSGSDGRINKEDILRYVHEGGPAVMGARRRRSR